MKVLTNRNHAAVLLKDEEGVGVRNEAVFRIRIDFDPKILNQDADPVRIRIHGIFATLN